MHAARQKACTQGDWAVGKVCGAEVARVDSVRGHGLAWRGSGRQGLARLWGTGLGAALEGA